LWGKRLIDVFPMEGAAQRDIERFQRDALHETARQLAEMSVEVLMQKFGVDRKTAQYWVSSATGR
jgi:nucleotidyltransferase/DNA polymerase involved in DNA repair